MDERCRQVIKVTVHGKRAQICLYEKRAGRWRERRSLRAVGVIGRNGATTDKREGDGCTPCGMFAVGDAFFGAIPPLTRLTGFPATPHTLWVDDPSSKYYNQRVRATDIGDWRHAERMADYAEYTCGFVIAHNPTCSPHRGSAVFFHVKKPRTVHTAGCVAVPLRAVCRCLRALRAAAHPHILIENA